jgi:hypothetical protein
VRGAVECRLNTVHSLVVCPICLFLSVETTALYVFFLVTVFIPEQWVGWQAEREAVGWQAGCILNEKSGRDEVTPA